MNYASSSRSEADEAGHYPHRNRNLSLPVKVSKRSEPLRKWTVTGTIEILVAKPKKGAAVDRVYRALADRAGKRRSPVACKGRIASGGLCLSRRDGPDVGGELAVDEARGRE